VGELKSCRGWEKTVKEAVDRYQKEMITRAGEEVISSKTNMEMLHDWIRFKGLPIVSRFGDGIVK
jgi:hypothetical protein